MVFDVEVMDDRSASNQNRTEPAVFVSVIMSDVPLLVFDDLSNHMTDDMARQMLAAIVLVLMFGRGGRRCKQNRDAENSRGSDDEFFHCAFSNFPGVRNRLMRLRISRINMSCPFDVSYLHFTERDLRAKLNTDVNRRSK